MIKVIRSMKRGFSFWQELPEMAFTGKLREETDGIVIVDSNITFQTHLGFGGAFTEAAAKALSYAKDKEELMNAYFSDQGLKYNIGRTVVHSCDFSVSSRLYIEDNDETLDSFDISADDQIIIPMIKKAIDLSGGIWLLASPWSPPAFMKMNQAFYYGGALKPEYYQLWANYLLKYVLAMKDRDIKIEAITIQNEPEATQVWESCIYTSEQEANMVDVLYQTFDKANMDIKIVIWDHNRDRVVERAHGVLKNQHDKVWGVGYHWYMSEESENLSVVKDMYPDKHILFTEGCSEFIDPKIKELTYKDELWKHGEQYGRNYIKDSLNYSEGFIDWNLFLDEKGGPNHVGNFCEAPMMINQKTGEVQINPSYYYIGHFSKYIKQGAKRIHIRQQLMEDVYTTAYKNPNGEIIIVAQNEGWIRQIEFVVDGKNVLISLPDHSISTIIID